MTQAEVVYAGSTLRAKVDSRRRKVRVDTTGNFRLSPDARRRLRRAASGFGLVLLCPTVTQKDLQGERRLVAELQLPRRGSARSLEEVAQAVLDMIVDCRKQNSSSVTRRVAAAA